LGLKAEGE